MKKIMKNIFVILVLVFILLSANSNTIYAATQVQGALLIKIGDADYHLKYYNEEKGADTYIKVSIVGYFKNDLFYPTYCTNKDLNGVGDIGSYHVDVDSIYDNDKVWRAIKNGYPYKTATEMGLSLNWNAYVVTKMAVYCLLGQSDINLFSADNNDAEAVNMLKALKNLVNIGLYGEETYSNDVSFEKENEFIEEGRYYTQEYKVVSDVEVSEYIIKSISGFPVGSIVVDEEDNVKNLFKSNERFKIKIPKAKMDKDIDGLIDIEAKIRDCVIYDGKSRITGAQNCIVTVKPYNTINVEVNVKESLNKANIVINKTDEETGKGIIDTEFEIYNLDGEKINQGKTDINGKLQFSNLYQGRYIIKEKVSNDNYVISNTEYEIELNYGETKEVNITNKRKRGNIKIYKKDKENDKISLGNVEFDLYSYEENKIIGTYFTDVNGEIYIENLRVGKYKLIEKNTNKWYDLTGDTEIDVKWNETSESTVHNELKKGQIKIIKQDKDNSEIKLQGVKFHIIDSEGNLIDEIITDEEGIAISKKVPINDTYTVKEIETLNGYILNENQVEVTLQSKEIKELVFENEKIKSKIKIIKQDKEDNQIKLEGVKFNILNSQGELIEELTTNEDGETVSSFLPINEKYIIKEISTKEDYVLNETPIEITLDSKETKELIIENEKIKGQIKIVKQDKDNSELKLQNVKFNILNSNGEVVQELVTNERGEAITHELPINTEYTIIETETLDNYILNNEPINVKIESKGIKEVVIENEKIKGRIEIIKTSSNDNKITGEKKGTPLLGVEFNIYDEDDNLIERISTDKSGVAISNYLEKGKYKVKEVSTNENYILNTKIYEINIENNEQIIKLEITNDPINPNIDIEKNGPNEAIIGKEIKYEISLKNDGNIQLKNFKWVDKIDTNYIKVTNLETGIYNQEGKYSIYYKTNLSNNEYILLMEDLDTTTNNKIDFTKELSDNEFVTEIALDFGEVNPGFSSVEKATISAIVKENVKSEDTFVNEVKIEGEYNGYIVEDLSKWKTIAYKILPETGF